MCLTIDTTIHPMIGSKKYVHEPIVTKRPLVVWKYLERRVVTWNHSSQEYTHQWKSPYFGMVYEFGKLYTTELGRIGDMVRAGLHAFRGGTKKAAQDNSGIYEKYTPDYMLFPALIPAGSKIFVSDDIDCEVVSNQLIVFSDMKALKAYTGVSRLARPVHAQNLKK